MDLLNVCAKIKLDSSEYKRGLSEVEGSTSKTGSTLGAMFAAIGQKIGTVEVFAREFGNSVASGLSQASQQVDANGKSWSALKSQIGAAEAAYRASQAEVNRLTKALELAAAETGEESSETQDLAQQLKQAESEMRANEKEVKDLTKELNEYGEEAEEAGEKSGEAGEKIKEGFGKVGKFGVEALKKSIQLTAAAIAAVATGVGVVVKKSVEYYGEYEQLAGGAKKIFNGMDFSVIKTDAQNAYKELNMSMNDYIEAMNLAGATFTATMGDQKAYETARKGMLAISDFATGTGKDVGELTQKYQMITRAATSYQSIADQFAGILPQTSDDFLAQAQAAGILSEEYTKLTEVPVAEYQQAVTDMLVKGVDGLGLANNAAKESMGTLTGSMAMTKAAWENLLTAMGNKEEGLTIYIDRFVEAATATAENILPIVEQALNGVGKLVEKIVPKILAKVPGYLQDGGMLSNLLNTAQNVLLLILNTIGDNLSLIIGFAQQIVDMLVSAILQAAPAVIQVGFAIIEAIGQAIIDNVDKLVEAAGQIIESFLNILPKMAEVGLKIILKLADSLTKGLPQAVPTITKIMLDLAQMLVDNLPAIIVAATQIIIALAEGLTAAAPQLMEQAPILIDSIMTAIIDASPVLAQAAAQIILVIAQGMIENLPQMIGACVQLVKTIADSIVGMTQSIFVAGANLITGLWNGIKSKKDWLINQVKSIPTAVIDTVKGIFKEHSPSKVFYDIGENLGIGLGLGYDDSMDFVHDKIEKDLNYKGKLEVGSSFSNAEVANVGLEKNITKAISDLRSAMENMSFNFDHVTEIDGKVIHEDSYNYTVGRLTDETRSLNIAHGGAY